MVMDYLCAHGYVETLAAFEKELGIECNLMTHKTLETLLQALRFDEAHEFVRFRNPGIIDCESSFSTLSCL
jgi:hypothetical protein